jgi:phage terminase large subunit-like protein
LAAKFIDCAKREMPADVAGSRLAIGAYRTHRADRIVAEGKDERQ